MLILVFKFKHFSQNQAFFEKEFQVILRKVSISMKKKTYKY